MYLLCVFVLTCAGLCCCAGCFVLCVSRVSCCIGCVVSVFVGNVQMCPLCFVLSFVWLCCLGCCLLHCSMLLCFVRFCLPVFDDSVCVMLWCVGLLSSVFWFGGIVCLFALRVCVSF